MLYSSIESLIKASSAKILTQLTDDAGTGTYDVAILTQAMTDAKEEMDPYLRPRYSQSMPFAVIPGILGSISDDISLYRVYKRRGHIPENYLKAYEQAVDKLNKISKGIMALGTETGGNVPEDGVSFTSKIPEDRVFRAPEGY
jgi:phage gp36-like protein